MAAFGGACQKALKHRLKQWEVPNFDNDCTQFRNDIERRAGDYWSLWPDDSAMPG